MSRSGRSVVVVGAGVGGLAAALALQRAGWDVRVRERAGTLEQGGAGLVLWPNALRCLGELGVLSEVRARGHVLADSRVLRPDGRRLSRLGVAAPDVGGAIAVLRADLVAVLAGRLGPGVLALGAPVDEPDLDLATREADLVVGADGLRSVVRTSLWPAARPVRRGYVVWRAVLRGGHDHAEPAPGLTETWGRGVRFGVVPVGTGATYVYAVASDPGDLGRQDELALLARCFGEWHDPVPGLLDRLDPSALLRHDVHDLAPGGTPLHRGRHVLVGDAAHAMEPNLGQGACLALEDAVVLAHRLAVEPSIAAGLAAYDDARRRRVAGLARRSRQVGVMARQAHPWGISVRDAGMRVTPDWCARLAVRGATGWRPPTSEPTALREPA